MKSKALHIRFDETGTEGISMKAELKPGIESYDIFFRSDDISLTKNGEAFLSVGLLSAMKNRLYLSGGGDNQPEIFQRARSYLQFLLRLNDLDVKRNMPCALRVIEQ